MRSMSAAANIKDYKALYSHYIHVHHTIYVWCVTNLPLRADVEYVPNCC
jgi:hypothetical protein